MKTGVWYVTSEGDVMVTGQAVPRQPAGVYDYSVRDRSRRVLFTSRDRAQALGWVEDRIPCIIAEPHSGDHLVEEPPGWATNPLHPDWDIFEEEQS